MSTPGLVLLLVALAATLLDSVLLIRLRHERRQDAWSDVAFSPLAISRLWRRFWTPGSYTARGQRLLRLYRWTHFSSTVLVMAVILVEARARGLLDG